MLHHRISSFSHDGAVLADAFVSRDLVLQEQPMQAPKPQPMRSSKLIWPAVRRGFIHGLEHRLRAAGVEIGIIKIVQEASVTKPLTP